MWARILLAIEIAFATCVYGSVNEELKYHDSFIYVDTNNMDEFNDWHFWGYIDYTVPKYFNKLCKEAKEKELVIRIIIDSPGGSALSGYKLCRITKEYKAVAVAGSFLGAHSAAAIWWAGSSEREFKEMGSEVSFHRTYIQTGDNEWSYNHPLISLFHLKEDNIITENFNVTLATLIKMYMDIGMEHGPISVVEFRLTGGGVFISYFDGNDRKVLVPANHNCMSKWHHYIEKDLRINKPNSPILIKKEVR